MDRETFEDGFGWMEKYFHSPQSAERAGVGGFETIHSRRAVMIGELKKPKGQNGSRCPTCGEPHDQHLSCLAAWLTSLRRSAKNGGHSDTPERRKYARCVSRISNQGGCP